MIGSGNTIVDALVADVDTRWNGAKTLGTPTLLTYSFMESLPSYYPEAGYDVLGFQSLAAAMREAVRTAITAYEQVAGLQFVEVSDAGAGGLIRFGGYLGFGVYTSAAAEAFYPADPYWTPEGGDVWLNYSAQSFDSASDLITGGRGVLVILHEIGHAVGLKHPGDYGSDSPPFLPADEDIDTNTVMSYYSDGAPYPSSPQPYDIQALQYLYGTAAPLWLRPEGSWTDDTVGGTAYAEEFIAGSGDDTVSGDGGGDLIYGNAGNDLIYGNLGADTLYGGRDLDSLFGGQQADAIYGNLGNDLIYGNLDTDTLYGGQGDDTIYGGQGDDIFFGNLGNDTLWGNLGDDTLSGGDGADTFVCRGTFGNDLITDFSAPGGDRIDTDGVPVSITDGGNGVVLVFGSGATITLAGLTAVDYQSGWLV